MRIFTGVLLTLAVLLTGGLIPATYGIAAHNGRDGQPAGLMLVTLCFLRAIVLIAAVLTRSDLPRLLSCGGVLALEFGCVVMHYLSIDQMVLSPLPNVYGVLATLLPLGVIAAVFLGARNVLNAAAASAFAIGLLSIMAYGPLTAKWRAERMNLP